MLEIILISLGSSIASSALTYYLSKRYHFVTSAKAHIASTELKLKQYEADLAAIGRFPHAETQRLLNKIRGF
jgi:hypothetical protein